jgi:phage tail protein X
MRIASFIEYTTRAGDTFDTLALTMYNNERQAHHIIAFNPAHADVVIFEAGVRLRLPIIEDVETPETLPPWRREP